MGSWNDTCGLSGLPIEWRTPVLLFPLVPGTFIPNDGRSGFTYATGLWQPLTLPIMGLYNDYGTVEAFSVYALTANVLRAAGVPFEDTSTFLEQLERGNLNGSRLGKPHPVGQTLIRQDVWGLFLEMTPQNRLANRQDAELWIEYITTHEPSLKRHFDMERYFDAERSRSTFVDALMHNALPALRMGVRFQIERALEEGMISKDAAVGLARHYADVVHVNLVMEAVRRQWGPQGGKGSQDSEWELHKQLAEGVLTIANMEIDKEEP